MIGSFFSLLETGSRKNNIAVLDGVRALACLAVIAFHINILSLGMHVWTPGIGILAGAVAMYGGSGVTLFFVLSGFLLFRPFAKAILFAEPWPSVRSFYLRRALRIWPAYYASLFLMIVLVDNSYLQPSHWKELGLFLTFFMDSSRATFRQLNGPFWTLAIEWQFYLLLPLLALGLNWIAGRGSLRRRWWMLCACFGLLMAWGVVSRYWGDYYSANPSQTMLFISRPVLNVALFFLYGVDGKFLEDFAVGMLISCCYLLSQRALAEEDLRGLTEKIRRSSFWLWRAGILVLLFMTLWNGDLTFPHRIPIFDPIYYAYPFYSELGLSIGFGLCVTAILFGPTTLRRPFEWPLLRWVGIISYSLYIWHLPILDHLGIYFARLVAGWSHLLAYSLFWLCALLIVIPFSYLFYRWIELPWMQLGDKIVHSSHA